MTQNPLPPLDESAELAALARQIREYEIAYRSGNPVVSDAAFDELVERYAVLADTLGVSDADRIDLIPGVDHTDGFAQVIHRVPMLSLEKLTPNRRDSRGDLVPLREQLVSWYQKRIDELGLSNELALVVEPKVDGISVSLLYQGGRLQRAVTRGDGKRGDDITAQVRAARAVPDQLRGVTGTVEVRGEIYWPSEEFSRYNEGLARAGVKMLANPRNGAAGLMKRKNPAGLDATGIASFLYQVPWHEGVIVPETQSGVLQWLADLGAPVYLDEIAVVASADEAFQYCSDFASRKELLGYDIDGMVIKLNPLRHYERLSGTGHHPHWAIAYKFPPEKKPTKLLAISVQVGKSGKLTPVAELDPVRLAGTTVVRASLHNFVEVQRKDIRVGDTVFVEKAGEIIPQVLGVDMARRSRKARPFVPPETCPACETPVLQEEIFVYCPNPACPEQVRERLRHFSSRSAMDIEGLGESLVDQLVEHLGVRVPPDLWAISKEKIAALERMGTKSADNLQEALERAKGVGLTRVLVGLSIRHLGTAMAEALSRHFRSMDALLHFAASYVQGDQDSLEQVAPKKGNGIIEGMAKKTADTIFAELNSPEMRSVVDGLAAAGVDMRAHMPATDEKEGVVGKTFVLTGTLPTLKRSDAADLIKRAGGKVASSVSKKTDYVVAGSDPGSKRDRAEKLNVAILTERELLALLE